MNKSYLIAPIILIILFSFLYTGARKEMIAKEADIHAKAELKKAEEKKRKDEIEARATADAQKRQAERDAADLAKEAKKVKDYEDAMKALRDEADKYSTEAAKLAKEATALEAQISQSRTDKEKLVKDTFELAKQVELAKINRRTAEIEIQRVIEIVGKKLSDSSIVVPPLPPPLPTAK